MYLLCVSQRRGELCLHSNVMTEATQAVLSCCTVPSPTSPQPPASTGKENYYQILQLEQELPCIIGFHWLGELLNRLTLRHGKGKFSLLFVVQ